MTTRTSVADEATLERVLPPYLGRQRWYAGPAPDRVDVVAREALCDGMEWMLVDAGDALYQVVVGARAAGTAPEFLSGNDTAVLGVCEDSLLFDAVYDPEYAKAILRRVVPDEAVALVRPMGAEQSNSSLVFDDRLVLKLFRRLHSGPNPDVEVTSALASRGFGHVAGPLGVWRHDGLDLAVCTQFLAGGAEGWALALTSLRDLYATGVDDPAGTGGDFAAEASRLGAVTAGLHLAMADSFGAEEGDPAAWADAVEAQIARLHAGDVDGEAAERFVQRLRGVSSAGTAIRVHGDYHLGQVMRTDAGWFVLDFEGEPARTLEERRRPSSPLKDVTGMLRSFQYVAGVALRERDVADQERLGHVGEAWAGRNRRSFLKGYFGTEGIERLLPAEGEDRDAVLAAFELDKAVYEVRYERAHRPDWVEIPLSDVRRLLHA